LAIEYWKQMDGIDGIQRFGPSPSRKIRIRGQHFRYSTISFWMKKRNGTYIQYSTILPVPDH